MKKTLITLTLAITCLAYGLLIGKYEVFPYNLIKSAQDYFEEQPIELITQQNEISYEDISPESLISVHPKNSDSLRSVLSSILFGSSSLPNSLPDTIFSVKDNEYADLIGLQKIDQFEIVMEHNIKSIGYIFHPIKSNNRLAIYHQGHRGDFLNGKNTIRHFIDKGYTVYALCMPLSGKNNQPMIDDKKLGKYKLTTHGRLKFFKNPMKYFISPIITMINHAESKNFDDICMIGVSGGGWSTTLAAAVDTRIKNSFPVAGTYPMYVRFKKNPNTDFGDFEQSYGELFSQINYMEMYILGAIGEQRKQIQVLNKYDPCCFSGNDFKSYQKVISQKVESFEDGFFNVLPDTTHSDHKISEFALSKIDQVLNSNTSKK